MVQVPGLHILIGSVDELLAGGDGVGLPRWNAGMIKGVGSCLESRDARVVEKVKIGRRLLRRYAQYILSEGDNCLESEHYE